MDIPVALLTLVMCILAVVTLMSADEVTVISLNRDVPGKRLTCWMCRHSQTSPNANCIHMNNKTAIGQLTCHIHEPFCRVRKLMNDDHVELLERSCVQTCNPGCQKIKNVQKCESCCAHQLCNIGNKASLTSSMWPVMACNFGVIIIFAVFGT